MENSEVYDRLDTGQVTTERNMLPDGLNFAQIQVITRNSEVSMVSPKDVATEPQQLVSFKNSQSALILQNFQPDETEALKIGRPDLNCN